MPLPPSGSADRDAADHRDAVDGAAGDVTEREPRRVRMDPEERRAQILAVARRLFSQRPYSQVSVSDIAAEAGMAKGLLHHYFGSKRELYLAVVRELAAAPMAALSDSDDDAPWDRTVREFVDAVGRMRQRWLASVNVGGAESDDEVASILDESREVIADQTLVALGLADRSDDPVLRAIVRAYGGFVQELTVQWLARERLDRAQVETAMIETLPLIIDRILPLLEEPQEP